MRTEKEEEKISAANAKREKKGVWSFQTKPKCRRRGGKKISEKGVLIECGIQLTYIHKERSSSALTASIWHCGTLGGHSELSIEEKQVGIFEMTEIEEIHLVVLWYV